jgi:hypothetical protein
VLEVATITLLGDYNLDGRVNSADYIVWRNSFGKNVLPQAGADGSGNGLVDEDDYDLWKQNFGNSIQNMGSGGGAAVEDQDLTIMPGVVASPIVNLPSHAPAIGQPIPSVSRPSSAAEPRSGADHGSNLVSPPFVPAARPAIGPRLATATNSTTLNQENTTTAHDLALLADLLDDVGDAHLDTADWDDAFDTEQSKRRANDGRPESTKEIFDDAFAQAFADV